MDPKSVNERMQELRKTLTDLRLARYEMIDVAVADGYVDREAERVYCSLLNRLKGNK